MLPFCCQKSKMHLPSREITMSFTHTILVTGGTSGLGFHCALDIAKQHPEYKIIIASRTDPKFSASLINNTLGQKNVEYLPLNLSSLANVRSFAKEWDSKNYPPIQALVLNAGVQFPDGIGFTEDGLEKTFAINHVGHALLFHLLYPHLANKARVVITSSGTHDPAQKSGLPDAIYNSAEELAHPTAESEKYTGRQRYATSKLTNVLWAYALHRRFTKNTTKNLTVTAFDPGLMPGTGLAREAGPFLLFLWNQVMPRIIPLLRLLLTPNTHTPQESGASLARAAVGVDVKGISGVYYEGRKEIKSSEDSYNVGKQEDLWEWTVKNTAANAEEISKFEMVN
jgi:NAD(P)-dependent dehydrogenase (short-subunit alcohol dehydrogenase family)